MTIQKDRFFVRNIHMGSFLETYLVSGAASLLAIRFYLAATGFPKIGGAGLHIAHMLWGGLFMLVAIVLLLAFLGREIQFLASVIGGIGFGTFIDELGKFITNDNNYFFQPTIAIIYIIFVLMLLVFRFLERRIYPSEQVRLANALDILKEGVLRNMHGTDKTEALLLLRAGSETLPVNLLVEMIESLPVVQPKKSGIFRRITDAARNFYVHLVDFRYFPLISAGLFLGYALVLTLFLSSGATNLTIAVRSNPRAGIAQMILLASCVVSDVMIVIGIFFLRREPLRAYNWLKRAILVAIFVSQIFLFYSQQLNALGELAVNLIMLSTLNYLRANRRRDIRTKVLTQTLTASN